jgi:glycosyltransferase involved in cell wall biosynthesis
MPDNIYICYSGEVSHENVSDKMIENDLFFLPTMGENFGHVIIEALGCGCPVLISDQTPWKNLSENNAGWELSIDDISTYRKIIEQLIVMNSSEFKQFSQGARQYAKNIIKESRSVEKNRELFQRAWRGKKQS